MKKDIFLCCLFALLCLLNLYDGYGNYSSPPIYREDRNHRAVKDYNVGYDPPLFPSSISILKNDTVFCFFFSSDTVLEFIFLNYYSVKKKGGMYIRTFEDGSYWVIRYKKKYKLSFYEMMMRDLFVGEVVKAKSIFRYDEDGNLTEFFITVGYLSYSKQCGTSKQKRRENKTKSLKK